MESSILIKMENKIIDIKFFEQYTIDDQPLQATMSTLHTPCLESGHNRTYRFNKEFPQTFELAQVFLVALFRFVEC